MHGRTSLSILALLMPAWALFSIGIDDWSQGSRRPIEFECSPGSLLQFLPCGEAPTGIEVEF